MSRILIVFGTTEGHTAKVARCLAESFRDRGVAIDAVEAGTAVVAPEHYDGVVIAASVHAGGYQRSVRRWVRAHRSVLAGKPTAFVSGCLGILQKDTAVHMELAAIAERFFASTAWRPTLMLVVAGALPYTKYAWLKRWLMKRIVAKAGGDTDTTRDYEYTNWTRVAAFAAEFAALVAEPQ